jgi:hypothetical protein
MIRHVKGIRFSAFQFITERRTPEIEGTVALSGLNDNEPASVERIGKVMKKAWIIKS